MKQTILTEQRRIKNQKKEVINNGTRWGKIKRALREGRSNGEQARIDAMRGKDIIGTGFGDILPKHSEINHSWSKRNGT